MRRIIVQGDVMLRPVDAIPDGEITPPSERGHVLAEGEATGHAHVLDRARLISTGNGRYVDVSDGAVLRHEDHGPIPVAAGGYEVIQQVEYDPQTGLSRAVLD